MYMNENIPSRKLNEHVPEDIESMCVEINLRKQKWIIIGLYRPPKMNEISFLNQLSKVVDLYGKRYDRIVTMGDLYGKRYDRIVTMGDLYSKRYDRIVTMGDLYSKRYDRIVTMGDLYSKRYAKGTTE